MSEAYKRKYLVSVVFLMAMAVIALSNLVDDYVHARWHEVFLNSLMVCLCFGTALFVRPNRVYPRVYWVIAIVLTATCLYFIASPGAHGGTLFWLYFLPPISCYFLGLGSGIILTSIVFALASLFIFGVLPSHYAYPLEISTRFALSFVLLSVVTAVLDYSRRSYARQLEDASARLREEKGRLSSAMKDVKVLTGLLPTCAACKSIRDDDNVWHPIEEYISERSEAGFSHSICPTCTKTLYPELDLPFDGAEKEHA